MNTFDLANWTGQATLDGGSGADVYLTHASTSTGITSSNVTVADSGKDGGVDSLTIQTSNEAETIVFKPDRIEVYSNNSVLNPPVPAYTFYFSDATGFNLERLIVDGNGGSDTLVSDGQNNQWTISGINAGTLTSEAFKIALAF